MGVVLITVAVIVVAVLVNRFVRWQVDRQKVSRFRRNAPWDLTTQDTCVALLLGRIMADGRSGNLAAGTEVVAGVSPSAVSVWDRECRLLGRLPLGRVRGVVLEQQAYGFFVFSGRNYTTGADDYPIRTGRRHEVMIHGPVVHMSVPPHQNARYFVEMFHKLHNNPEVRVLGSLPADHDELVARVAMSPDGLAERLRKMTDEGLVEQSGTELEITDFGVDALAARVAWIAEMARKSPL